MSSPPYAAGPECGGKLIFGHPAGLERFLDEWDAGVSDVRALGRKHHLVFLE